MKHLHLWAVIALAASVSARTTTRQQSQSVSPHITSLSDKFHVAKIPQGSEPAIFKQYFSTWRDVGMSHSRIVRSPNVDVDSDKRLYEVTADFDNGLRIEEVESIKQADLNDGSVYILANGDNATIWIGNEAPVSYVNGIPKLR